jgi:hypothetical protein
MIVNREIETMVFEHNRRMVEAKSRLNNIRRIKREKCVNKIVEKMKTKLKNKQ